MTKILTKEELYKHLKEQIYFLQSSAKNYDNGVTIEAKQMATRLRVLVWDKNDNRNFKLKKTERDMSLLRRLDLKEHIYFVNTAQPYQNDNLLPQQCLVMMHADGNGVKFLPLLGESTIKFSPYLSWGKQIVISDSNHKTYNRLQLIKLLANKDGGAHVDLEIEDELENLKNPDVSGWKFVDSNGQEHSVSNDLVYCSMRQMTYEILQTLYRVKPELFEELYF